MTISEHRDFFDNLLNNGKFVRLGKLFKTKNNYYLFDVGTGKVLSCTKQEYLILKSIFDNDGLKEVEMGKLPYSFSELSGVLKKMIDVIKSENLLKAPPLNKFDCAIETDELKDIIENDLKQLTLELTQNCNLRCRYCFYNEDIKRDRNFANIDMTWDIAKKGIDYAFERSAESIAITFYGGEPLLKFELVKKCIEYSQWKNSKYNKNLSFSLTTNLTLLTRNMAKYFATVENFAIVCSLDGPREVHDMYRIKRNGKGSFEDAIKGLKILVEEYGEKAVTDLSINCVICPPYTVEKIDRINDFFSNLKWLPNDMAIISAYAQIAEESMLYKELGGYIATNPVKYIEFPIEDWINRKREKRENIFNKQSDMESLVKIHQRSLTDIPFPTYSLNGCCVPGAQRLYITAKGDFKVCEKIENAPKIGNIDKGIDIGTIKQIYINQYISDSLEMCKNCWAVHLCDICYSGCFNQAGQLDINDKMVNWC